MTLAPDDCYQVLQARDARFDGAFFVGVSTTGIYCRPVCTAKLPKRSSCTFHPSAAAAEEAGFRPCLRCRPELAPGRARIDALDRLAARAASRIEDGALTEGSVAELARSLGTSERHLRRAVERAFGVSPVALAQTQRLLLAKRLLTDTNLTVTQVALASGFSSLRRFNALFSERYRLSPTALRRKSGSALPETLICNLPVRLPFAWDALLDFFGDRAIPGVEERAADSYRRTLQVGTLTGWISVRRADEKTVRVEVSAQLAPVLSKTLARVKRLLDLDADPCAIDLALSEDPTLAPLVACTPGLRLPGAVDGFELAMRAVLGQQISVAAARTIAGRLVSAFGQPLETPHLKLTHVFPTAERLAELTSEDFATLGLPRRRAETLHQLAEAVASGAVNLTPGTPTETVKAALLAIPGIGSWTAEYVAMRALSWPDAFPTGDLGLLYALDEIAPKRLDARAEGWRPWRSYAAIHLWRSLSAKDEKAK